MKTSTSNVIAVIPVFQPDPGLWDLINAIRSIGIRRLVVVDDGSDPGFRRIFDQLEIIDGVTVLRHAVNLGKGQALKTAFNHVLLTWPSAIGVVTLDADGQHRPEDVQRVAESLVANPEALILGARDFDKSTPWRNHLGNRLSRWGFRILVGRRLADTQTGLRGVPMASLPKFLPLPSPGYAFELQMLIHACGRSRIPIVEIPIAAVYFEAENSSHFNSFIDSLKIVSTLIQASKIQRTRS